MPTGKAKLREYNVELRRQRVFDLWKEGVYSLRQISDALTKQAKAEGYSSRGLSYENVRRDLQTVLDRNRTEFDMAVHDYRTLQLARLNDQYLTFNALAKGKIDKTTGKRADPDKDAGRLVLRVIREISETVGIKASIKHEITGKDGGPIHVMSSIDLSKLTTEELKQYEQLLKKANSVKEIA